MYATAVDVVLGHFFRLEVQTKARMQFPLNRCWHQHSTGWWHHSTNRVNRSVVFLTTQFVAVVLCHRNAVLVRWGGMYQHALSDNQTLPALVEAVVQYNSG